LFLFDKDTTRKEKAFCSVTKMSIWIPAEGRPGLHAGAFLTATRRSITTKTAKRSVTRDRHFLIPAVLSTLMIMDIRSGHRARAY
jgi:hypothetical protein